MIQYLNKSLWLLAASTCASVFWLGFAPINSVAADTDASQAIEAAKQSARALDRIVIEWTRERKMGLPEGTFYSTVMGSRWIKGDTSFIAPAHGEFKYNNGKVYIYYHEKVPKLDFAVKVDTHRMSADELKRTPVKCTGSTVMETDVAFDGEKLYHGSRQMGGVGSPILLISTPDGPQFKGRESVPLYPLPYLRFAGLTVPSSPKDYAQRKTINCLIGDLVDSGGHVSAPNWSTVNGTRSLRLSVAASSGSYIFDVDPTRSYAVKRYEETTVEGRRICLADLGDLREVSGKNGVWLPRRCVAQYFQWNGQPRVPLASPILVETYAITRCESKPISDEDFVVIYNKPGSRIGDTTLPNAAKAKEGQIAYTVPADPKDLDDAIQRALEDAEHPVGSQRFTRVVLVLATVSLLLGLIALCIVRRRRRLASPQTLRNP